MVDLARASTDPDERAYFFEHEAGCRELSVASGTDWAEMRIAENAWFRFATAAYRAAFRFRVHGGKPQTQVNIANQVGVVCDEATRQRLIALREKLMLAERGAKQLEEAPTSSDNV